MAEITETQADLITDIFGDDDDDDFSPSSLPAAPPKIVENDDIDEMFKDSDDDEPAKAKQTSGKLRKSSTAIERDLLDSDEERPKQKAPKDLGKKKIKKRKLEDDRSEEKGKDGIHKKKLLKKNRDKEEKSGDSSAKKTDKSDNDPYASGNEYESGEEVPETEADRAFIDGEDEHDELMKEYAEDNQTFQDENDEDDYDRKKKSSSHRPTPSGSSATSANTKSLDPLSQMLLEMKRKKKIELSEPEKDIMIGKLQHKMDQAVKLDNQAFTLGQPAVYKVKMLPVVQQIVSMKVFHSTLLDRDFLCTLRDWITPRDAETLPALAVRTGVYEMLLKLPCMIEHLKRTNNEKPPIGVTIVQLRKHKKETPENKRMLKEIMDRWSRPIFGKSMETTNNVGESSTFTGNALLNADVQQALVQRYYADQQQTVLPSSSANTAAATTAAMNDMTTAAADNTETNLDTALSKNPERKVDMYQRARAPTSSGYLFTVQPESKSITKQNVVEKALGENRMKLYKKMTDTKAGLTGTGKKENLRYVCLSFFFSLLSFAYFYLFLRVCMLCIGPWDYLSQLESSIKPFL